VFSSRLPASLVSNRLTDAVRDRRAQGQPFVDLTLANPTRAGFDYPPDLLARMSDRGGLRYEPEPAGVLDARLAVAADYVRRGIDVAPGRIVLTASTSDAYGMLFKLLTDAGDDVLVPRPSYPLFDHLTRLDQVIATAYDLDIDGGWSIDFESIERALTPRTRAVLLVSPNNPTGSAATHAELERLAAVCAPRGIAIIVDEVFADYELEPGHAASVGQALSRSDVLSFALGGLSKSVGLPQVKLGWIAVAGPAPLTAAAIDRLELVADTYLSVSTPVQLAARDLLARGATVREQIITRVRTNYRWLRGAVAAVPSCRVLPSGGGWYAVMQVPTLESEEDLVVRLLTSHGVLTHPGYFFDFPRESYLVVSLLPQPETFADGIARVFRHFDCTRPAGS
jgi:alanine-synthesizing transaminase